MSKIFQPSAFFFLKSLIAASILMTSVDAKASPFDFLADAVLGQTTFSTFASGSGNTGQNIPSCVVVDPNTNRIYVSEFGNHRILSWPNAYAFTNGQAADLVLGQANFAGTSANRGGSPDSNTLNNPKGLALDSQGNLFVADTSNNRVLVFLNPSGDSTVASRVFGQPDFTTVSSGTTNSKFNAPNGVWVDLHGHLFVADTLNHRVLGFNNPLTSDAIADEVWGQTNFTNNSFGTTSTTLFNPDNVVTDLADNLYIADGSNNRVVGFVLGYGGDKTADRVFGQPDMTTGTSGTTASKLTRPIGMRFDSNGSFYVSDYDNNRILIFDTVYTASTAAGPASRVMGQSSFTSSFSGISDSKFDSPFSIAFDMRNNLYATDSYNHRTLRFDQVFTDTAPTPQFSDNTVTAIADSNLTYPKSVKVSGLLGTVNKVTVVLKKISHTYPSDLDVFLVGPTGAAVKIMSDVGSSLDLNYVSLTFDDAAATSLDGNAITTGTYKPSDLVGSTDGAIVNNLPTTLSTFNNLNPNGDWSLFIVDDSNADRGALIGWGLNVFTTPVISYISGTPTTVKVGDTVTFSASGSASPNDALTYSWNFGDGTSGTGSSVTHTYGSSGTFTATLTLSAASGSSSSASTSVTVNPLPTDLKPVSLTAKKSKGKLTCTFYVQNAGSNPAAATTAEVRFGVASDSTGKSVKRFAVPALAAKAKSKKLSYTKAPGGYRYCRAVVDSAFALVETNESNNAVSKLGR